MTRSEMVESALDPMRAMLMADGYLLDTRLDGAVVELSVAASPDACADCLVPKEMFAAMAADMLTRQGVTVNASTLSIVYPGER